MQTGSTAQIILIIPAHGGIWRVRLEQANVTEVAGLT